MFAGPMFNLIGGGVLAVLFAAACASDLRSRRIPNILVLVTLVLGIGFSMLTRSFGAGALQGFGGFGAGLVIWIPFYALGMVGAGDVKLFAAASAWIGARSAVEAALWTAIAGGVLALLFMVTRSGVSPTLMRLVHGVRNPGLLHEPTTATGRRMPYALAIAVGCFVAFLFPGQLLS
jgi:prepilin peptidase CpaA